MRMGVRSHGSIKRRAGHTSHTISLYLHLMVATRKHT